MTTGKIPSLALAWLVSTSSFAQQLPPLPPIPAATGPGQQGSYRPVAHVTIPKRATPVPIIIHVAVNGSDSGDGSQSRPFQTLTRAQAAVRLINATNSVTVQLARGTYRLEKPLRFTAKDGGHNSYIVTWEAAPDAHPVISGGTPVTDWSLADAARNVWMANIPRGTDPRQLWVNNQLAERYRSKPPALHSPSNPGVWKSSIRVGIFWRTCLTRRAWKSKTPPGSLIVTPSWTTLRAIELS